jgi:Flp pilus assembly protein TadG
MRARLVLKDTCGAALVEFSITLALLMLLIFSLIEGGMALYTQVALQHGVAMAARCAGSLYCLSANSDIPAYASANSLGLNPGKSYFTTSACDSGGGNQVKATYAFKLIGVYTLKQTSLNLTAQSCFPSS